MAATRMIGSTLRAGVTLRALDFIENSREAFFCRLQVQFLLTSYQPLRTFTRSPFSLTAF